MTVLLEYKRILHIISLVLLFLTLKLNADDTFLEPAEDSDDQKDDQSVAEQDSETAENPGSEDKSLDSKAGGKVGHSNPEKCEKEPVNEENNQNSKTNGNENFKDAKKPIDETQQEEANELEPVKSDQENNSDSIKFSVKLDTSADDHNSDPSPSKRQSNTKEEKIANSDGHKSKRSGKSKESMDEDLEDDEDELNDEKCDEDYYDDEDEDEDSICGTSPECTTRCTTTKCPTTPKCTTPCPTRCTTKCAPPTRPRCTTPCRNERPKCPRAKGNRRRIWYSVSTERAGRNWDECGNKRLAFKKKKFHGRLNGERK